MQHPDSDLTRSAALGGRMGTVATMGLHVMQRQFHHRRAVARQRPAAQPAAVAAIVNADHLIELLVVTEPDAVALKKGHGGWSNNRALRAL